MQIQLPVGPSSPTASTEPDEGLFDPQRAFLLPRFRAFHAELTRLKRIAQRDATGLLEGLPPELASVDTQQLCAAAKRQLQLVLEKFALDAAVERGGEGATLFREAEYAFAALADEIFLTTDWVGREAWLGSMLEQSMFGSQIAGEDVFRRIDLLLRSRTAASLELASVYLMTLALGFEGQYRGGDGQALAEYRRKLYRFLYRADGPAPENKLVPQAYDHTTRGERPVRLPYVQRWMIVLGVTLLLYLIGTEIVWRRVTADLTRTASDIVVMARRGKHGGAH